MSNPKFITRLRVINGVITDLVSENEWTTTAEVVPGIVSGHDYAIGFSSNTNMTALLNTLGTEDFTMSLFCNVTGVWGSPWYPFISQYTYNYVPTSYQVAFKSTTGGVGFSAYTPYGVSDFTIDKGIEYGRTYHIAVCRTNGHTKYYIDGVTALDIADNLNYNANTLTGIGCYPAGSSSVGGIIGTLDDVCIIKGKALWTSDFTPPRGYVSLKSVIYLSGNEAYGVNSSGFSKLSNDYTTLTDAEKVYMYDNIVGVSTVEDLYTMEMPINLEICTAENNGMSCIVYGIPDEQLIISNTLTNITKKIRFVGILGSGNIKVAITKDGNTYQVYNFTSKSWETIDIAEIPTRGMSIGEIQAIIDEKWEEYNPTQLGFAFYLTQENIEDKVEVSKIVINYSS